MPYPPNPADPPKQVLKGLLSTDGTPVFSWMPDWCHVVLGLQRTGDSSQQLWLADTASSEVPRDYQRHRFPIRPGSVSRRAEDHFR